MSGLSGYLNKKVAIITTDGCFFVGTLEGYDGPTNLLLRDTQERVLSDGPAKIRDLGTYIVRGEMVAVVGLVDEELDRQIDWDNVHADSIGTTKHKF